MKRGFRMLMAALCSVVFLCGFSVTAYAGGGDEVMDHRCLHEKRPACHRFL